jgi:hypothetical protein
MFRGDGNGQRVEASESEEAGLTPQMNAKMSHE